MRLWGQMLRARAIDVEALYARHRRELLVFFARRTADPEVALDVWAETFAQVVAGRQRYRGKSDDEAAAWLYAIARSSSRATTAAE